MTGLRDRGGSAGPVSGSGGAVAEILRAALFFVLIASIAAVLTAGAPGSGELLMFENPPLCLHSTAGE